MFVVVGATEQIPEISLAVWLGSLASQGRPRGLVAVFKGSSFRRSGHFKVSWGDLGAIGFRFLMILIRLCRSFETSESSKFTRRYACACFRDLFAFQFD